MNNRYLIIVVVLVILGVISYIILGNSNEVSVGDINQSPGVEVSPISHASFVLQLGGLVVYNDPVGDVSLYESYPEPDLILVSDIHSDHFSADTLEGVIGSKALIVAPSAVVEELPKSLEERVVVMSNQDFHQVAGVSIEAIPMYNLPPSDDAFHVKGRGNGYVLESNEVRVYIAGDTADIPEMRTLEDIDVAFIPMNLPYTMDVDVAADAVVDFAPKVVYPYHYRGTEGLSDITEFTRIVAVGNPEIKVVTLDWYPVEVEVNE